MFNQVLWRELVPLNIVIDLVSPMEIQRMLSSFFKKKNNSKISLHKNNFTNYTTGKPQQSLEYKNFR